MSDEIAAAKERLRARITSHVNAYGDGCNDAACMFHDIATVLNAPPDAAGRETITREEAARIAEEYAAEVLAVREEEDVFQLMQTAKAATAEVIAGRLRGGSGER